MTMAMVGSEIEKFHPEMSDSIFTSTNKQQHTFHPSDADDDDEYSRMQNRSRSRNNLAKG